MFRTYTISPGGAEELVLAGPQKLQFFMTSDDDVVWLSAVAGELDIDQAVRLDRAQCPVTISMPAGTYFLHSPQQGGRTVQVSVVFGGAS